MNEYVEKRLRYLFKQFRRQDEEQAPSFIKVWAEVLSRQKEVKRQPIWALRFAAIVGVLVIVGLLIFKYPKKQEHSTEVNITIEHWRSPTASLLNFSMRVIPYELKKRPTDILLNLPGQHLFQDNSDCW